MNTQLTPEQSMALNATVEHRLTVTDPATNSRYVIVEVEALERLETINSIRNGLSQMESSEGQPLAEAMDEIRSQLKRSL